MPKPMPIIPMGRMNDPHGSAYIKGICGDTMEMYLTIEENKITGSMYHTDGCHSSQYCGSAAAQMAVGKTIGEILAISPAMIIYTWPDMPRDGLHCSILAVSTLHKAIAEYLLKP